MKSVKISLIVAIQNIRKWRTNYRIWILVILTMIFVQCYTKEISTNALAMGMKSSPWLYPFLYTDRYIRILFMLPLIFIYCDAPFIDKNQIYILMRCKRKLWSIGQIIYIFMTSAMYFSLIAAMTIVLNIRNIEYMNDWGKVLGTLAFFKCSVGKRDCSNNKYLYFNIFYTYSSDVLHLVIICFVRRNFRLNYIWVQCYFKVKSCWNSSFRIFGYLECGSFRK